MPDDVGDTDGDAGGLPHRDEVSRTIGRRHSADHRWICAASCSDSGWLWTVRVTRTGLVEPLPARGSWGSAVEDSIDRGRWCGLRGGIPRARGRVSVVPVEVDENSVEKPGQFLGEFPVSNAAFPEPAGDHDRCSSKLASGRRIGQHRGVAPMRSSPCLVGFR